MCWALFWLGFWFFLPVVFDVCKFLFLMVSSEKNRTAQIVYRPFHVPMFCKLVKMFFDFFFLKNDFKSFKKCFSSLKSKVLERWVIIK